MAFFSVTKNRSNLPWSTDTGAGALTSIPAGSQQRNNENTGGFLVSDPDCDEAKLYSGLQFNPRFDAPINEAHRISSDDLNRLQKAAWLAGQVMYGTIGPTQYNVSGAINIEHSIPVEITAASGNTLTISGIDVHKIGHSYRTLNPDWPGLDGSGDPEPKYIYDTEYGALPLGAEVRFVSPSILSGKLKPFVVSYNRTSSTTATLTLSADVSNARKPYDASVPPDSYHAVIVYHRMSGVAFGHVSPTPYAGWIRRSEEITTGDLDGDDKYTLTDTAGNDTRVLLPGAADPIPAMAISIAHSGGSKVATDEEMTAALTIEQSGSGWTSSLDLTDLLSGLSGVTTISLVYFAEMTADDDDDYLDHFTLRLPASCVNSRKYPGITPAHAEGSYCARYSLATGISDYQPTCYLPSCSHFALHQADGSIDGDAYPVASVTDQSIIARAVSGIDASLEQLVPGFPYFLLVKQTHNSLYQLAGGFHTLQYGLFPIHESWNQPVFGQREEYTDSNGDKQHHIIYGSWYKRGWVDFDGDDQDYHSPGTSGNAGLYPSLVSFRPRSTDTNLEYPDLQDDLDSRYIHRQPSNVHGYDFDIEANVKTNALIRNGQLYATNADPDVTDATTNSYFQSRFA